MNYEIHPILANIRKMAQSGHFIAMTIILALDFPDFFKVAPLLMPKKLKTLMKSYPEKHEILNEIARDQPWQFAFNEVINVIKL